MRGIEPPTFTLQACCSSIELHPQNKKCECGTSCGQQDENRTRPHAQQARDMLPGFEPGLDTLIGALPSPGGLMKPPALWATARHILFFPATQRQLKSGLWD